jgi:putative ABC transport system ATP-binding protein
VTLEPGKTTFMRLCAHLISPSDGNIFFHGKDMREFDPVFLRKEIAYCFQEPFLFGNKVEENLILPLLSEEMKLLMTPIEHFNCLIPFTFKKIF